MAVQKTIEKLGKKEKMIERIKQWAWKVKVYKISKNYSFVQEQKC